MNVERIRELADIIEKQPHVPEDADEGFCMAVFRHECGTPSCIAGWAVWAYDNNHYRPGVSSAVQAAQLLDIAPEDGDALFYPKNSYMSFEEITPAHAVSVLRRFANTGEVDWSLSAWKA